MALAMTNDGMSVVLLTMPAVATRIDGVLTHYETGVTKLIEAAVMVTGATMM